MAALSLESERDKLRFMLVGYYLDLFKQKNLARVYEQNIVLTRQILADIKARYTEGVSLENDITRYELQLSNLELQQTRIGNAVAILNRNLVTMLGLPEDTRLRPDTSLVSRSMPLEECRIGETKRYVMLYLLTDLVSRGNESAAGTSDKIGVTSPDCFFREQSF